MRIHNNTAILYTQKGTRNNYCRLFMGAGGGGGGGGHRYENTQQHSYIVHSERDKK